MALDINPRAMQMFWRFVNERQQIAFKRELGLPAPWTKNKYLRKYKFTNVYRELDRGSQWAIEHIIRPMRNDIVLTLQAADSNTGDQKKIWLRSVRTLEKELFWQLFVYRMINRWETFAAIGFPSYQHWDRASYMRDLDANGRNGKRPIFSSAYITCQCSKKQDRVHNFCDMADDMHTKLPGLYKLLRTKPTLQVFCKALTKVFGIAGFTAFQISLDLVYAGLLPDTRDEWADPGPGCRAGLGFIFPEIKIA